jgi:hypothetical protein
MLAKIGLFFLRCFVAVSFFIIPVYAAVSVTVKEIPFPREFKEDAVHADARGASPAGVDGGGGVFR